MFIKDSSEKNTDKTRKQYSAQVESNTRPKGCDFFVKKYGRTYCAIRTCDFGRKIKILSYPTMNSTICVFFALFVRVY